MWSGRIFEFWCRKLHVSNALQYNLEIFLANILVMAQNVVAISFFASKLWLAAGQLTSYFHFHVDAEDVSLQVGAENSVSQGSNRMEAKRIQTFCNISFHTKYTRDLSGPNGLSGASTTNYWWWISCRTIQTDTQTSVQHESFCRGSVEPPSKWKSLHRSDKLQSRLNDNGFCGPPSRPCWNMHSHNLLRRIGRVWNLLFELDWKIEREKRMRINERENENKWERERELENWGEQREWDNLRERITFPTCE